MHDFTSNEKMRLLTTIYYSYEGIIRWSTGDEVDEYTRQQNMVKNSIEKFAKVQGYEEITYPEHKWRHPDGRVIYL